MNDVIGNKNNVFGDLNKVEGANNEVHGENNFVKNNSSKDEQKVFMASIQEKIMERLAARLGGLGVK